ncbi:MAG: 7-carboxy-7-deazaguanine synthase QueE, partial [Bacteroidetes bacterium]
MEEFYTIQGEGFNTGKPAYFVRIGGCDVGCHWCDVKESWDASIHPLTEA